MSGYARRTDPQTSHEAGADVSRSERIRRHKNLLERVFQEAYPNGLINSEAGELSGLAGRPGACPWRRVTELWEAGIVDRPGDKRLCPETNKSQNVHVWIPPAERVLRLGRPEIRRPLDFIRWLVVVGDDEQLRREVTLQQIIDRARMYLPMEERHTE